MVNNWTKAGSILLLFALFIIAVILPYYLIYLSKIIVVFILIAAIIFLIFGFLNSYKENLKFSALCCVLSLIYICDSGFFYKVNAAVVFKDENIFIVDKNEPIAIMSCGTIFTLFIEKKWGFQGYEVIPNKYCFEKLPDVFFDKDEKCYTFYLRPNGYVKGTILFYLDSKEIIANIRGVREAD